MLRMAETVKWTQWGWRRMTASPFLRDDLRLKKMIILSERHFSSSRRNSHRPFYKSERWQRESSRCLCVTAAGADSFTKFKIGMPTLLCLQRGRGEKNKIKWSEWMEMHPKCVISDLIYIGNLILFYYSIYVRRTMCIHIHSSIDAVEIH